MNVGVHYIVFSSTAATYGIPEEIPILETTPQKPINPYGESKLMMETIMRWADQTYGIKYVPLRYFNVAGAKPDGSIGEDHGPETHLLPIVLQVAQGKREKISILGDDYKTPDGTNVRDYVHPFDLADAHLLAVEYLRNGNPSTAFNLGSSTGFSIFKSLKQLARWRDIRFHLRLLIVDREIQIPWSHPLRKRVLSSDGNQNLIISRTIIQTAWAWHSSHPDGYNDDR